MLPIQGPQWEIIKFWLGFHAFSGHFLAYIQHFSGLFRVILTKFWLFWFWRKFTLKVRKIILYHTMQHKPQIKWWFWVSKCAAPAWDTSQGIAVEFNPLINCMIILNSTNVKQKFGLKSWDIVKGKEDWKAEKMWEHKVPRNYWIIIYYLTIKGCEERFYGQTVFLIWKHFNKENLHIFVFFLA